MRLVLGLFLFALLQSCGSYQDIKTSQYYAIDSLITGQVLKLSQAGRVPFKSAQVNQKTENDTLGSDSTVWANELNFFRELDLNSPRSLNAYEILTDNKSFTYRLKPSEKQEGVIEVYIEQFSDGSPALVQGRFKEENDLYANEREYELRLDGDGLLQYYGIGGRQKVAFGEWVNYRVTGNVSVR